MKEIIINKTEDGIRFNKYIKKILPTMPDSLFYKLLRKKYFVLNEKKAKGSETLISGDVIKIFIGDDTYEKYSKEVPVINKNKSYIDISNIIYEDEEIILYDKPSGLLSQGDKTGDESVNSILYDYVKTKNSILYKPSIVNRLDRNTSGIIIFAKTYIAAREISKMIKEQRLGKYYMAHVNGIVKKDKETLINFFKKDEKNNIAIISDKNVSVDKDKFTEVKLTYKVIKRKENTTLLDIDLITGKSHQIRAQLAHIGHPIVCDKKYMVKKLYDDNVKRFKKSSQELCCYKIKFDIFDNDELKYLNNKTFEIER